MVNKLSNQLKKIINFSEHLREKEKRKYLMRIEKGNLTMDKNPADHFVVALVLYDSKKKKVFIGHHKKSNQWVFPGGHIEESESPRETAKRELKEELGLEKELDEPFLFTETIINNPGKQKCKLHYDVWFFIPVDRDVCTPDKNNYLDEFYQAGWRSFSQARGLITVPSYLKPIDYIERYLIDPSII